MSRPPPKVPRPRPPAPLTHAKRALLRLGNALHDAPPDPGSRKRRLLEGLCETLRADAGVCVVTHSDGTRDAGVVSVARWGMSRADADAAATHRGRLPKGRHEAYHAADHCVELSTTGAATRPAGKPAMTSTVKSANPAPPPSKDGVKLKACLTLFRRRLGGGAFTARDRDMLGLFHSEMTWLYGAELPPIAPQGMVLSPRQRQTLQLLLAGHGEKQIAADLGLSHNTVHHYVKAIHRHFRVSSRSELLARWVIK